MKTPSISIQCNKTISLSIQCDQTPELTKLISDLCKSTNDFINDPDSPLGDLSAELDQLLLGVTPKNDIIIITMVFDISKCEIKKPSFITNAAKEACTSANALPRILNYCTDLPFGQFSYNILPPFNDTLIFIATYPMN